MYRGVPPPLGYLLAPPWSSITNLWWWLFMMWGYHGGWAANIARARPTLRVGGWHFSKCFLLFKGEKNIFFKKFSNNCLGGGSRPKVIKITFFNPSLIIVRKQLIGSMCFSHIFIVNFKIGCSVGRVHKLLIQILFRNKIHLTIY